MKYLKFIIPLIVLALATGIYFSVPSQSSPEKQLGAVTYETLTWDKPTKDFDWAEDVKKESLNFKLDYQLEEMKTSLEEKIIKFQKPLLDQATLYPDSIRWEYIKQGIEEPELTKQVNERIYQYKWEYEKMAQSIERINKEIDLRKTGKVDRTQDILSTKPSTEKEKIEINKLKGL